MITKSLGMCVVWAGDDRRRPYLLYSQLKNQVGILLMIRETCESGWSMVQVSISMLLITENITDPRQEYWSEVPFLSPGGLPDSWIKPTSPALGEDSLPLSH